MLRLAQTFLVLVLTSSAWATNFYKGEIELLPGQAHGEPVTGEIYLGFPEINELKYVQIELHKPLFGRMNFQGFKTIGFEHFDLRQLSAAYYLEETPHSFYFALAVTYNCLIGRLEGKYFRVQEDEATVEKRLSGLVDIYDLPETWIPVGTVWLVPVSETHFSGPDSFSCDENK